MGLFVVGLITGLFLGLLLRDIWKYIHFWFLLGISTKRERQEKEREMRDGIQQLEDHINDE